MLSFPDLETARPRVFDFTFREALSGLFSLTVSAHVECALSELVGERAVFEIDGGDTLRAIHGVVREAHSSGDRRAMIDIAPALWLCSRRRNNRIFQNLSVPQIVAQVLADYPAIEAPRESLNDHYEGREYVTQFGERDLDFVMRLLADEGIVTYFDHSADSRLVLTDRTDLLTSERSEPLPYLPASGMSVGTHAIQHISQVAKVKTSRTRYRDHDYRNPSRTIEGDAEHEREGLYAREQDLESYEFHVGGAEDEAGAARRARHSLEAARATGRRAELSGNIALPAGVRIRVEGHHHDDLPDKLLVVQTTLTGLGDAHQSAESVPSQGASDAEMQGHFQCIDASYPFRPRRLHRPQILGSHTAVVVPAEPGDEIDVDEMGRVLIEFPWDRRGLGHNTSRRVRVSQGWAGADYGFVNLPRVGDEVVVTFLGCDPDQPLIVGRVFNGHNRPPLNLPQERTRSIWRSKSTPGGGGYNHILFEDLADRELVEIRAQRNYHREVLADSSVDVGGNSSTVVGHDRTVTIGENRRSTIGGNEDERVDENVRLSVGGDRRVDVEGEQRHVVHGNNELVVHEENVVVVELNSAETIKGSRDCEVQEDDNLDVGGNRTVAVEGDAVSHIGGRHRVDVGDALELSCGDVQVLIQSDGVVRIHGATRVEVAASEAIRLASDDQIGVEGGGDVAVEGGGSVAVRGATVSIN